MKLISIVLPTYNGEKWLSQSIESIIVQSYKNWELIIVNDCSTDNTAKIVEKYAEADARIKIITNKQNQKLPKSLNIGFSAAAGDYYTWTSDDNWYQPDAFEKMINFLENNPDHVMVVADFLKVYEDEKTPFKLNPTPYNMLKENSVGACFMYRADTAKKVGPYNTDKFLIEDYEYWLRMTLAGKIGKIDEFLYNYRLHEKSLSSQFSKEVFEKTLDIKLSFLNDYKKKFPQYDFQDITADIALYKLLYNNSFVDEFIDIYKANALEIYKNSKHLYYKNGSDVHKNIVRRLGIKYFLKSLFWKKGKK